MAWRVIADDLSGAAETAASLLSLRPLSTARFAQDGAQAARLKLSVVDRGDSPVDVDVVDSDNRRRLPEEAAERMTALLADVGDEPLLLKYDSLLRGNIGAELATVLRHRPVLFCSAVPAIGRTLRDGVVHVDGVPLHRAGLWDAESTHAPVDVAAALVPAAATSVPLSTVRTGALESALDAGLSAGAVIVADAETDADLRLLAQAAVARGYVLAGAAGLASALSDLVRDAPVPALPAPPSRDTLFVLGTASTAARAQLALLERAGVEVLRLDADGAPTAAVPTLGDVAVVVDAPVDPARSQQIVSSLADLALRCAGSRNLVLSGGETARAVLDALGIDRLVPTSQPHMGAVLSLVADGRRVVTRPGSYGGADSLTRILAEIATSFDAAARTTERKALA